MARWNERRRLMDHVHSEMHQPRLQDVAEPNLMRGIFSYDRVPVVDFNHRFVLPEPPARMLITDTTFRDGQQARPPYKAKQIGQIFFEELELPVIAKTPKGAPSTAESVLQELAEQGHELPQVILEHRGLAKLRSTYTDKLPEMVDPVTGRLHTSYHQAVAATGRLS